jgi:hypothetical protein
VKMAYRNAELLLRLPRSEPAPDYAACAGQ